MDVTIRDATPADAPFLAWVMLAAARSHRPLSFWDYYARSQISHLIGNTPAQTAYERVGFETIKEKRHPDFEAAFGSPGIARMVRSL